MGAETFFQLSKGKTAAAAFKAAVEQAQYDYGHSGYTGTVAEKDSFVKIPFAVDHSNTAEPWRQAEAFADRLISDRDSRIDDKWGPAGCIEYTPANFSFSAGQVHERSTFDGYSVDGRRLAHSRSSPRCL